MATVSVLTGSFIALIGVLFVVGRYFNKKRECTMRNITYGKDSN